VGLGCAGQVTVKDDYFRVLANQVQHRVAEYFAQSFRGLEPGQFS
jgi:hypothetical protein